MHWTPRILAHLALAHSEPPKSFGTPFPPYIARHNCVLPLLSLPLLSGMAKRSASPGADDYLKKLRAAMEGILDGTMLAFCARALTSYVASGSPSPERPSTIAYLARCARLHSLAASGSPPVTMKQTPTDAEQAYVVSSAGLQAGELSCISLACQGRKG